MKARLAAMCTMALFRKSTRFENLPCALENLKLALSGAEIEGVDIMQELAARIDLPIEPNIPASERSRYVMAVAGPALAYCARDPSALQSVYATLLDGGLSKAKGYGISGLLQELARIALMGRKCFADALIAAAARIAACLTQSDPDIAARVIAPAVLTMMEVPAVASAFTSSFPPAAIAYIAAQVEGTAHTAAAVADAELAPSAAPICEAGEAAAGDKRRAPDCDDSHKRPRHG